MPRDRRVRKGRGGWESVCTAEISEVNPSGKEIVTYLGGGTRGCSQGWQAHIFAFVCFGCNEAVAARRGLVFLEGIELMFGRKSFLRHPGFSGGRGGQCTDHGFECVLHWQCGEP